jgi:hypothetical protein
VADVVSGAGDDFVFACTGRGTHRKTEAAATVLPVLPRPRPGVRSWQPPTPLFALSQWHLPRHMEVRCPECGRALRLGRRMQNQVMAAHAAGIVEIDISYC